MLHSLVPIGYEDQDGSIESGVVAIWYNPIVYGGTACRFCRLHRGVMVAVPVCGTYKTCKYTLYLRKGKLGVILKFGIEGLMGDVEQVEKKGNATETGRLYISDKRK